MAWLCRILEISRSGYYAWLRRGASRREQRDHVLARELVRLHQKYPAMGLDSLFHLLKPVFHCSRKRIHRLMKKLGINSLRKKAYKVTTNSRHGCPIAPNLLSKQTSFTEPNLAWCRTYIPTNESWLYLTVMKELCAKEIIGYAFIGWMTPCALEQKLLSAA